MKRIFVISVIIIFGLCGCGTDSKLNSGGTIDYVYAKELMINENAILVDVRSEEEYNEGHIDGALLLPVDSINEDSASEVIESKDSTVIVYCRSGSRSSQALQILNGLGYENVYDLGAMSNWKE